MDNIINGSFLIASDDVSGGTGLPLQIQRVRLDQGTEGTSSPVNTASPLKVDGSSVTQPITGVVSVSNFPSSQPISVTNFPGTQVVKEVDALSAITAGPITTASTQVFTTDTTGYKSIGVQVFGAWTGGVTFQTSNDNSNWYNVQATSFNGDTAQIDTAYGDDLLLFPATGRYFQCITSATFIGSVSIVAYLRSQPVTLLPATIGITADPATPLPMGGMGPDGIMRRVRTDLAGNITPSDAPPPVVGSASLNGAVLCLLDTTGYQLVSLQLLGTWTALVSFQCSNDAANWVGATGTIISTSVQTQGGSAVGNGIFTIPAYARWFRVILTSYTSGNVQAVAYLRSLSIPPLVSNQLVSGTSNAGSNAAAGAFPLQSSGVDPSGLIRRMLTDVSGATNVVGTTARDAVPASTTNFVPVAGWDANQARRLLTDVTGAVQVAAIQASTTVSQSLLELQTQVLLELKQISFILRQLPMYLNSGIDPLDDDLTFRDDPTNLLN